MAQIIRLAKESITVKQFISCFNEDDMNKQIEFASVIGDDDEIDHEYVEIKRESKNLLTLKLKTV